MKKLLLSIKPCYVDRILSGNKRVEFRKTKIRDTTISKAMIYRSNDIKKIVGEFDLKCIINGSPEEIWASTKQFAGIGKDSFFEYFKNSKTAYAYIIENVMEYPEPLELSCFGLSRPPMSYCYVNDHRIDHR